MRPLSSVSVAVAVLLPSLLLASSARADAIDTSAGVKLLAGASLWTTPSDRPGDYEGIGFAGNGGGFSYGFGVYGEVRFIKVLSLEIDILRDKSTLMRNVDHHVSTGQTVKLQEKIELTSWRIPVLAKANLPTPFGRLFVLLGPEFVRSPSAEPSVEVTEGNGTLQNDPLQAHASNYTMITGGMGLTIDLASLEIPLELRASKNLGQDEKWGDRVEVDSTASTMDVDAQTSWDFRVGAGLGYRF